MVTAGSFNLVIRIPSTKGLCFHQARAFKGLQKKLYVMKLNDFTGKFSCLE